MRRDAGIVDQQRNSVMSPFAPRCANAKSCGQLFLTWLSHASASIRFVVSGLSQNGQGILARNGFDAPLLLAGQH
jgi:hypothetical protein